MNTEKICFSSDVIQISETDKAYLEMTNRVCYYGAPNLNGVILPAETAEDFAATLVDMPVYAKCRVNADGEPTFGSHEVKIDENGDLLFDTIPIGVHTSVEVKEDTVTIGGVQQTLPCLFATQKIWTRNTNAVAAIKRLFSEGRLHNSWELQNNAYTFENGLKTITDYAFVGNTMLGYEYADPAYGESAKVLSISAEDQLMVAEALSRDLIAQKEDTQLNNNANANPESTEDGIPAVTEPQTEPVSESQTEPVAEPQTEPTAEPQVEPSAEPDGEPEGTPAAVEPEAQVSSLTDFDLYDKISNAARALLDQWCWVSYLFPEERYVLLKTEETEDELSYVKLMYSVGADDTVTVSDPQVVKLTVSISQINDKIAELNDTIASINEQYAQAQAEIEQLKPYREAAEKAEHDRKAADVRAYAEKSNQFSTEELESEEMLKLYDEGDMTAIKALIADRVVSAQHSEPTSQPATMVNASIADGVEPTKDPMTVMREFFNHKN